MLKQTVLGLCVLLREELAAETMMAADMLAPDALSALDPLENPLRPVAMVHR